MPLAAQELSPEEEMARKAQDPLADVKALMTDNSITYDWKVDSSQALTLPLGLTFGRTLLLGNGDGLDLSIGAYPLIERPDNATKWQLKLGISYFFN